MGRRTPEPGSPAGAALKLEGRVMKDFSGVPEGEYAMPGLACNVVQSGLYLPNSHKVSDWYAGIGHAGEASRAGVIADA